VRKQFFFVTSLTTVKGGYEKERKDRESAGRKLSAHIVGGGFPSVFKRKPTPEAGAPVKTTRGGVGTKKADPQGARIFLTRTRRSPKRRKKGGDPSPAFTKGGVGANVGEHGW